MTFSIIIPCYNAAKTILTCVKSALRQSSTTEIIIIDDCSTDGTWDILKALEKEFSNITCSQTPSNGGPGRARNVGLKLAKGDWVLFLDADDTLETGATMEECATIQIAAFIRTSNFDCDVIGYDWRYSDGSGGRKDKSIYYMEKFSLMKEFLSLRTDGSVIYTAIKRELIEKNNIKFPECQHEDVEFIFKVYWYAEKMRYLDRILYSKNSTEGSVVNTISIYHIEGFMGVWKRIGDFLDEQNYYEIYRKYYHVGCYAALATRIREIYRMHGDFSVYKALADIWHRDFKNVIRPSRRTKYVQIAKAFLEFMDFNAPSRTVSPYTEIETFMDDIVGKSWSCYDLHHSLFLAPDEIRTCCKRFFWFGKMKGDVVVMGKDRVLIERNVHVEDIRKTKMNLYEDINAGKKVPCDGCSYLEFKEWEPMGIEYLSLEYHSVCNLKCSYCSDTFYGGKQPSYDVEKLVSEIKMPNCKTVLWGGGEPTLGKFFNPEWFTWEHPKAQHRVLTNSVLFSENIERLLKQNLIHVTTSVDAATRETFKTVRGKDLFQEVFLNIDKYAKANPRRLTIKYVLTNENSTEDELLMFAILVKSFNWQKCNFQISCDFKFEHFKTRPVQILHDRLVRAGCEVVFVDDLLRERMGKTFYPYIEGHQHVPVAVWGAGTHARILLDDTTFFKRHPVKYFIDETKVGQTFMNENVIDIMAPEVLLQDDLPIVIAAVQGYPIIYDRMVKMGIEKRLVKELIL